MEYFREKRRAGLIDTKTCEKMMEVVNHIEENGFKFIDVIGTGTYGSVMKIRNPNTNEEMAAKVVQKNFSSEGEIVLWKNLSHPNILKLTDVRFVYHADSYVFLTAVYPKNLEEIILESSFTKNKKALEQLIEWLKQILDAVAYLHSSNFSHNDLKGNNILISNNNSAIVSDFGFLCNAEKPIKKYGVPFIYRCPEGRMTESGLTEVDGKKLDIWSIGMMAFELFTGMSLLKRFSKWDEGPLTCWHTQVYPFIQNNLEKDNFVKLIKGAFSACKRIQPVADNALNFLMSCLNIVPERRPAVQQLRNHKIFGGTWKYKDDQVNIWKRKVNNQEFNVILQQHKLDLFPETKILDSDNSVCGDYKAITVSEEKHNGDADPFVLPHLDANNKKTEATESSAAESDHHSSISFSESDLAPCFHLMFDSQVSSPIFLTPPPLKSSELSNVPVISQSAPKSRRLNFRKWWKKKKASFIEFLTTCCSCARKGSRKEELTDCK